MIIDQNTSKREQLLSQLNQITQPLRKINTKQKPS